MAYDDLFDEIDNCLGAAPVGKIGITVGVGASPIAMYALGGMPASITIIDVEVISLATNGLATIQVDTDIGGGGMAALTDAIAATPVNTLTRAGTIDPAQAVFGPADAMQATKNGANDTGLVLLTFYLS